jgi:choline dehydrogenase
MGIHRGSVVDASLRVHGTTNLRVADASVMPTITTGNTNAPTIAIAERAAQMIIRRSTMRCVARREPFLQACRSTQLQPQSCVDVELG